MKTARLIIGIVSCVLFVLVAFQSCASGLSNAINESESASGSTGIFLALCMLIAGIVGIAARKSKGGSITAGCFYLVGGLIGRSDIGDFSDLQIWSGLCFIFAAVFIIGGIIQKKNVIESVGETL